MIRSRTYRQRGPGFKKIQTVIFFNIDLSYTTIVGLCGLRVGLDNEAQGEPMQPNLKSILKQLDPAWSGELPTFGEPIHLKDAEGNPIHLMFGEEPIDISHMPEAERLRALRDGLTERYGEHSLRSPGTVNEVLDLAEARLLAMALLVGVPAAVLAARLDRVIAETAVTNEQLASIRLSLGIPEPGVSIGIAGEMGDEPHRQ